MKIAIIGYGRMGKLIHQLSVNQGIEVVYIKSDNKWNIDKLKEADVAIEFSVPNAAYSNIEMCIEHNVPVISGTTGWLKDLSKVEELVNMYNGTFLYGSNFSIGMNIFFKINKDLAKYMKRQKHYQCSMEETHHIHKLDKPSGTAITLAEDILPYTPYSVWTLDETKRNEELYIDVTREGEVTGYHSIQYDSDMDTLKISHNSKSRNSYAQGAIDTAIWLKDRKGVFTIHDYMKEILE